MAKTPRWAVAAQVAVGVAIVALGAWALQPGGYVRPVGVPREQVSEHLPKDRPERLRGLIRLPGIESDHIYYDQNFEITVDPSGHPKTVRYRAPVASEAVAPPAIAEAAVAGIRTWRFIPFQVKGRPVHAWFVGQFDIVPEPDRPTSHVPFPPVTDVNNVVMTYDEAGPRALPRAVTVHGNGHIEIANTSVLSQQHFQTTISQEQVLSLIDGFRRADFFSLKDDYDGGPTEGIRKRLSITIDGQTKTVEEANGEYAGLANAVLEVESALQRASGLDR